MDIRKADSKGRLTGFEPGRYYSLEPQRHGHTEVWPVGHDPRIVSEDDK
jgi:hypothetical protein